MQDVARGMDEWLAIMMRCGLEILPDCRMFAYCGSDTYVLYQYIQYQQTRVRARMPTLSSKHRLLVILLTAPPNGGAFGDTLYGIIIADVGNTPP